jgi:penicillin amidase
MEIDMKWLKRFLGLVIILVVVGITAVGVIVNPFGPSPLNNYTKNSDLRLPGLKAPVTVHRDEKGMAYIYAQNPEDLSVAQGFVAAQDRLFQMEQTRLFASGRISELVGEKARALDIRMRTLGFRRNAKKHAALLDDKARMFLQKYVDGVNAFIETRPQSIHLEFKLAGITPAPWNITDSLSILYYMGWNSAANIDSEIIAQMLVEKLGAAKAAELFPININPDEALRAAADTPKPPMPAARLGIEFDKNLLSYLDARPLKIGSNNRAVSPDFSPGTKPMVANDIHLATTLVPGIWYACGLFTPDARAVGVTIPGAGGMVAGRTDDVAIGVTNAYGDAQDLYVETVDPNNPDNYLEGDRSIPFEVIAETLKIKDKAAAGGFREETIKIRLTRRGPVISGIMPGLKTDKVISIRWSGFEAMAPTIGFERLMQSRTVSEIRQVLKDVNQVALNFVFADSQGNIGWQTTGKLPIRTQGQSLVPHVVKDTKDNWIGWIPFEDMPHAVNPVRGWVGTCNQLTVGRDYPYYYSTMASASYRYRRLTELMDTPAQKSADDHWQFQRDTVNLMAKKIAPIMAQALLAHADTKKMGRIHFSQYTASSHCWYFQMNWVKNWQKPCCTIGTSGWSGFRKWYLPAALPGLITSIPVTARKPATRFFIRPQSMQPKILHPGWEMIRPSGFGERHTFRNFSAPCGCQARANNGWAAAPIRPRDPAKPFTAGFTISTRLLKSPTPPLCGWWRIWLIRTKCWRCCPVVWPAGSSIPTPPTRSNLT